MTVASGELTSKLSTILFVAKVKAATPAHTMADAAIKPKENVLYP